MGKWKKKLEEWSLALRGVRRLNGEVESFPPGSEANAHGVVAVGGDLKPERLLAAYRRGLFPYYSEHQPILWRSPDPRFVIDLSRFRVPHNVRRAVRQGPFDIRFDTAFEEVVRGAASSYRGPQVKTWLNEELIAAYVALHKLGYAHSSEAWDGDRLM
ncbi:MAG: leucyl/phenylalanyl-tRNA--protein transferase, partial [Myxococcota bacterium]